MLSKIKKMTENTIIAKKKAILREIAQNLQKTSVGFDKLRANNWW